MVSKDSNETKNGRSSTETVGDRRRHVRSIDKVFHCRVLEQKKIEHHASMERTKELEKLSLLEQKKSKEDKQRQARLLGLKVTRNRTS